MVKIVLVDQHTTMAGDPRGDAAQAADISGNIVTVIVGSAAKVFNIHESILRSRSKLFNAALDKSWKEAQEGRIKLPEDKADIVQLYLQFLYFSKIYLTPTTSVVQVDVEKGLSEYTVLAELYGFGEKIQDVVFKNAVLDAILYRRAERVEGTNYFPETHAVDIIYKSTTSGSLARRLMVDLYVSYAEEGWIAHGPAENNHEFVMDLACGLIRHKAKPEGRAPSKAAIEEGTYHEADERSAKKQRTE